MDLKKVNEDLQLFWDGVYKALEPMEIKREDIDDKDPLDKYFKYLGDNAERIIDIGVGYGFSLVVAKVLGSKVKYAIGIDTSASAINFITQTLEKSHIEGINYSVGDIDYLKGLEDESFDGIICSNVLDVIPYETSEEMIKEIKRILIKGGILLLKFNFFLTEETVAKIHMEKLDERSFAINGVLRGVNLTTQEWISRFDGFEVEKIDSYDRINNKDLLDRILVLRKK